MVGPLTFSYQLITSEDMVKNSVGGFSNIIVGVVYQYPDADDAAMKEYLISTLMSLEAIYPSCAFILACDFNRTFLSMIQSAVK